MSARQPMPAAAAQSVGRLAIRAAIVLLLALLVPGLAGCGYHSAGSSSVLPPGIKVLGIPSFENRTHTYHLETGLTGAVIREFNSRTRYRVVQSASGADAVLRGTLLSVQVAPVTYDSVTGRASSGLVTIVIQVTITARDGRVLYRNSNYVFRNQYQVPNELASFFEEQGPALDRLQRDFARTLVSNILESY
jgi:outer membrane lipopolysaccharide assembly protein LptE/RlpB